MGLILDAMGPIRDGPESAEHLVEHRATPPPLSSKESTLEAAGNRSWPGGYGFWAQTSRGWGLLGAAQRTDMRIGTLSCCPQW